LAVVTLCHPACKSHTLQLCITIDHLPNVPPIDVLRDLQMEQLQAAEATSRKIVKEAPGAPNAPPQLTDECKLLADVAEPPNMKRAFETTLSVALLESQLSSLESKTGLPLLNRDRRGNAQSLSLTGMTAIAGMAAMVVLVAVGGTYAWRQYKGVPDSVTVVLKSAGKPRYNRVASSD
jgi:Golgi apparatus protein 1